VATGPVALNDVVTSLLATPKSRRRWVRRLRWDVVVPVLSKVVLVDPMFATGNSAHQALALLKNQGAEKIQFVCMVACAPGIERVQSWHPDVEIITAAIDPELNKFGFIVPGVGNAGDRCFGTG
jgi:uracil phosphoribosyltransferase